MSEAMSAEFDTVAEWTAQAAQDLGPEFHIPAGCRGSGSPAGLDWLVQRLELTSGEAFLDCGAGVGGPAAYAAAQRSVRPVLVEPEAGACRAALSLFGTPVVQAVGSALPLADESCDAAWALGVLCTTTAQLQLLTELRRVVRRPGRIGLLVFVARSVEPSAWPDGNHFPTSDALEYLVDRAGLRIDGWQSSAEVAGTPDDWQRRVDAVTDRISQRHSHERAWQLAEEQGDAIGRLIGDGTVSGELLSLRDR